MVRECGNFAAHDCPRDCPFLDRIASGQTMRFCSFALYADLIEAGRHTRTEILPDGTVDYHIPPNCDVYERYKGEIELVRKVKKEYERHYANLKLHKSHDNELQVTGHKHSLVWKNYR